MKGNPARAVVSLVGGCMLVGVAGMAMATPLDSDQVDINVTIDPLAPVGALTMTVAADSTSLTEVPSSDPALRQFDGTLPVVTVSDDRPVVPENVYWYVTGQSSAFTSPGLEDLPAGQLGWRPRLLTPSSGEVTAGDEVVTVLDAPSSPGNNVGLVSEELLASSLDSGLAHLTGSWDADADLFLKTSADVAPGAYQAMLTLSLWEIGY